MILFLVFLLMFLGCGGEQDTDYTVKIDEARILRQNGLYREAAALFEEAQIAGEYNPQVQFELAEVALLAAQVERNRMLRQKATEALILFEENPGEVDLNPAGELWRRLGWEMVRDRDSLQAFEAFERALQYEGFVTSFDEEWLFRGTFSASHLTQIAGLPDSISGTSKEDSLLSILADEFLVELDHVSLARTDLRADVLLAKASLYRDYLDLPEDELMILTELDRLGRIDPGMRRQRMQLLLQLTRKDMLQGATVIARERALEVWASDYVGEKVEAAVILGEIAELAGNPDEALQWYRAACSQAPDLTTAAAQIAAARRDSLMYLLP